MVGFQVVYGLKEIKIQRNKNSRFFQNLFLRGIPLFFKPLNASTALKHKQEEVIHLGIQYISTEKGESIDNRNLEKS